MCYFCLSDLSIHMPHGCRFISNGFSHLVLNLVKLFIPRVCLAVVIVQDFDRFLVSRHLITLKVFRSNWLLFVLLLYLTFSRPRFKYSFRISELVSMKSIVEWHPSCVWIQGMRQRCYRWILLLCCHCDWQFCYNSFILLTLTKYQLIFELVLFSWNHFIKFFAFI